MNSSSNQATPTSNNTQRARGRSSAVPTLTTAQALLIHERQWSRLAVGHVDAPLGQGGNHAHRIPLVLPTKDAVVRTSQDLKRGKASLLTVLPQRCLLACLLQIPVSDVCHVFLTCRHIYQSCCVIDKICGMSPVWMTRLDIMNFSEVETNWIAPSVDRSQLFFHIYKTILPMYCEFKRRGKLRPTTSESRTSVFDKPVTEKELQLSPRHCTAKWFKCVLLFGRGHPVPHWPQINQVLVTVKQLLIGATLMQFDKAYDRYDQKSMQLCANVLRELDAVNVCMQSFLYRHPIFYDSSFNALHMFSRADANDSVLSTSYLLRFMDHVFRVCNAQMNVASFVFYGNNERLQVMTQFVDMVLNQVINDFLNRFLAKNLSRSAERYLETMVFAYAQCKRLVFRLQEITQQQAQSADAFVKHTFQAFAQTYIEQEAAYLTEQYAFPNAEEKRLISLAEFENYKRLALQKLEKLLADPLEADEMDAEQIMSSSLDAALSLDKSTEISKPTAQSEPDPVAIEITLNAIQMNLAAVKRCLLVMSDKLLDQSVERLFSILTKSLTEVMQHMFAAEMTRLSLFKPLESTANACPLLTRFFEFMHMTDLVQQLVHLYFETKIESHIDKNLLHSLSAAEKRTFERAVDDLVAAGMDQCIQVMTDHAETILEKEFQPSDYNPTSNKVLDIKPSRACSIAASILSTYSQLARQCLDKQTADVLLNEIGSRIFAAFYKHIKRGHVSQSGGFQLICDINVLADWAAKELKTAESKRFYTVLRDVGNLFIIDLDQVKPFIDHLDRWQGILRIEDVQALARCRVDVVKKLSSSPNKKDDEKCSIS